MKRYQQHWTTEEVAYLVANYKLKTRRELASDLGRSYNAIKAKIDKELKIRLTKKQISQRLKRLPNAGKFTKGQKPTNTLFPGAVTIRCSKKNGSNDYYIKLSEKNEWILLSRYIWEAANGPLDSNSIVIHKDGNSLNCLLSNLEKIDKGEHARRNKSSGLKNNDYLVASIIAGCNAGAHEKFHIMENKNLLNLKRSLLTLKQTIDEQ